MSDSIAQPMPEPPSAELERFYRDLLDELGVFARKRTSTAVGAAQVVKRVALAHGIEVAGRLPLPRLTRSEFEDRQGGW
jgi:hypothetical protein